MFLKRFSPKRIFTERNTRVAGCFSLAYMVLIFILSSVPGRELPNLAGKDHYVHFLEFGILGFLLSFWAMGRYRRRYSPHLLLLGVMLFVSIYGFSDEIHQLFVPGRYCDVWDWVADTLFKIRFKRK